MATSTSTLFWVWLLPLLGAAFNLFIGRVLWRAFFAPQLPRRVVHWVAVGTVAASFFIALSLVAGPLWDAYGSYRSGAASSPVLMQTLYTWIEVGRLKIDLAFRLDTLSAVMILVVTFVGMLIHVYSTGYMAEEPRYAAYFGYLNLFTGAMLILVLANNLPVMFIGWEGVGLCSYLLIGFWYSKEENAYAGRKAFVVNRIGDFAFLLGVCLLFWTVGSLDFDALQTPAAQSQFERTFVGGERLAALAGILLFIGACGKSAQLPLYVWLPDAMAGPTPVSALIHAATMVTAGVYMVARMSFLYAASTTAMAVVATVGALTALFAAILAFAQTDVKRVLAYSTVSQLGFMFVGVGVGAYAAGIFHLVTHAFFKAGLFLGAGSVMHAMSGSGDIMKMGGLRKKLPITHLTFLIYCIAIAGIFPLSGFFSKDEILAGAFAADHKGWAPGYGKLLWLVLSIAALGTAMYMFRLYLLVFAGGECRADAETQAHIHESPPSMTVPLAVLALFTLVLGIVGLPHLPVFEQAGLASWIGAWLAPSVKPGVLGHLGAGTTLALMGIALVVGIAGIALAVSIWGRGPSERVAKATAEGVGARAYNVVYGKFYVDELYDLLFVRPFRWACKATWEFVDKFVIDLLFVNGSAFVVDLGGRVARWLQNGQVQRYLAGVVVGGAVIFWLASRPSASFEYTLSREADPGLRTQVETLLDRWSGDPSQKRDEVLKLYSQREVDPWAVVFRARSGEGAGARDAKLRWYVEGELQGAGETFTKRFDSTGEYEVTLEVTDSVFNKRAKVTKKVVVPDVVAKHEGEGR